MPSRSRPSTQPWWGVGMLSLAVAATSFAVPALLPAGDGSKTARTQDALTRAGATVTGAPTATTPSLVPATASPTPSAVSATMSATPTPTTPTPTKPKATPKPRPTFAPMTINPWAKAHESSGIAVIDCPTCASGKRVQYLGQGHYVIVRLKDVPVAGKRTMTVIYTCACDEEPRELDVMVNSDPVRTFAVKGAKSWDTPARFSLKITLVRGSNVIRFFNQEAPAPDLDQILIR